MPTNIKCPACSRALEIPDELMGKKVKCPACKMIFTATAGATASPKSSHPKSEQAVEQRVQRKRPLPRPEEDEDEDEEPRVRKKGVHRREEDEEDDDEEDERPRVRRRAARRDEEEEE